MRMYLSDLNSPAVLYDNVSDTQNVQWLDDKGDSVDEEDSALADRYTEYALMCRVGDEKPMPYNDWLTLDTQYQEHKRTAPNPLTKETFQRMQEVNQSEPTVESLQREVSWLISRIEELTSQKNSAIHSKKESEQCVQKLRSDIENLRSTFFNVEADRVRVNRDLHDANTYIQSLKARNDEHINEEQSYSDEDYENLLAIRDELVKENEELIKELETLKSSIGQRTTPANQALYPHYFRETPNTTHVDISWFLHAWDVNSVCGHAVKKLMCAGQRGSKGKLQDLKEACNSINRAIELEESK
jgi:DNA repair exonuclease SbcCD ATPase subunit